MNTEISAETKGSLDTNNGKAAKGSLQWKIDLGLYFTLVLVMKIGMCDLMIFRLA